MPDMLVPLYRLPAVPEIPEGLELRPARPYEGHALLGFVAEHFNEKWVSEVTLALAAQPAKVLVAVEGGRCLGFACYDVTARGFFGPTGVDPAARGRGLGKLLLLGALHALKQDGFAYSVIGQAGPVEFYQNTCGATVIPDSEPGYYGNSFA
ncbi:MAG: GNAT family N-acetyltransferase [Pseudomonadota bacterium]|nr:GNAT family N-acetyltransferase [Pseudomonadota bacterium]